MSKEGTLTNYDAQTSSIFVFDNFALRYGNKRSDGFKHRQEIARGANQLRELTISFSKNTEVRGFSTDGKYEVRSTMSGDYVIRQTTAPFRNVVIDRTYIVEALAEIDMKLTDLKNAQDAPKQEMDLTLLDAQIAQLLTDFDDDTDMDD